jgi:hypothetical protein
MKVGLKTIIILAAVVLIALSFTAFFVYHYYLPPQEIEKGITDCGSSSRSLDDFGNTFFDIDFNEDAAFSCMGSNINDDCADSKAVISDNGTEFVYKIEGLDCKARIELENPDKGLLWTECPISSLVSFAQEQAESVNDFQNIIDKMGQGDGNYGATIFVLTALSLTLSQDDFERLGCATNN